MIAMKATELSQLDFVTILICSLVLFRDICRLSGLIWSTDEKKKFEFNFDHKHTKYYVLGIARFDQ